MIYDAKHINDFLDGVITQEKFIELTGATQRDIVKLVGNLEYKWNDQRFDISSPPV